jgi:hypothetical protein
MEEQGKGRCAAVALVLVLGMFATAAGVAAAPPPPAPARPAPTAEDRFWERIGEREPPATMSLRSLFAQMLALAQSGRRPERLNRFCALAVRAQDCDPKSPTYGNFKWSWRDERVTDQNSVEFCMQDGALLWLKHRDWVPEPDLDPLRDLLARAIEGCLRHRVPFSYSNIAILNAANLIVLGEAFDRPEVVEEGLRRLDGVGLWTWAFGTHEYCSPTYYSVNLHGLQFLQAHARSERARRVAVGLLEVLWNDVALNWFPAAEKLAGAHSRSYDYLHGLGDLDEDLAGNDWFAPPESERRRPDRDPLEGTPWVPPPALRETSRTRLPRTVRQSWGIGPCESRTLMMHADVALSAAGAAYGSQDIPLAVDLAGDRGMVRCFFIADGREDPYGVKRYETSAARHMKALHLLPFWAGAQNGDDALGLVVYRPQDLTGDEVVNLQSHFVFRRETDEVWVRGRRVSLPPGSAEQPGQLPVAPGDAVVLRYGTAAVGLRLLWARTQDGADARAALVDDGNTLGALRLTVDHRSDDRRIEAGAALWVRVGSGLDDDTFTTWRNEFEVARAGSVTGAEGRLRFEVPGQAGPVGVAAEAPFGPGGLVRLRPAPYRGVLALDDREVGRPILDPLEFAMPVRGQRTPLEPVKVAPQGGTSWEAESGLIFPGMTIGDEDRASGGHYVWQPADRQVPRHAGDVVWSLRIVRAGSYRLWGRVLARDGQSNSFFVNLIGSGMPWSSRRAWQLPESDTWQWRPLNQEKTSDPAVLDLPAGVLHLQLQLREAGTKLDRLFLAPVGDEEPKE